MSNINGIPLFNLLEQYRKKSGMSVAQITQKIGIVRTHYYKLKDNLYFRSDTQNQALELMGMAEIDFNKHILKINGKVVNPNHDRLINSEPAREMITKLFQQNPKKQTIADIAIAFQTQEHIIIHIINDKDHQNNSYNLKIKA